MQQYQKNDLLKNPTVRISLHIIFWLVYLFISAVTVKRFYEEESLFELIFRFSITLPIDILATYFTVYYLMPRFLYKKKYMHFAIIFIASAGAFILVQRLMLWYITLPYLLKSTPSSPFFLMNWFYSFTNIYIIVLVVAGVKLVQRNVREEKNIQELNEKKTEAELKFLKAQVHPHFLFNTLNNLYALTLDQSPKASEVVLKLSELMNYMLYECNEETILISKEIKLLENYLSLERIRYEDTLDIDFQVIGETAGKKVAPMMLLPFVENAFKHGVSKLSGNAHVVISLSLDGNKLEFRSKNTKPANVKPDLAGYSEGIGLKNVQRRLELLYPQKHEIRFDYSEKEFNVWLTIILD